MREFVFTLYPHLQHSVVEELFQYQMSRLSSPEVDYPLQECFTYNIHDVIEKEAPLQKEDNTIQFNSKSYKSDLFTWAKEVLWFGRRVGKYKAAVEKVE